MGQGFSQATSNLGSLIGKSASFGVSLGGAIAAGIGTAGFGAIPLLPAVITSGIAVGSTLYDAIRTNSITSDWNETQNKILGNDINKVKDGLQSIADKAGALAPTVQAQREAERISNTINREHNMVPPSQIAKISTPLKYFDKQNNIMGHSARFAEKLIDIESGAVMARATRQ